MEKDSTYEYNAAKEKQETYYREKPKIQPIYAHLSSEATASEVIDEGIRLIKECPPSVFVSPEREKKDLPSYSIGMSTNDLNNRQKAVYELAKTLGKTTQYKEVADSLVTFVEQTIVAGKSDTQSEIFLANIYIQTGNLKKAEQFLLTHDFLEKKKVTKQLISELLRKADYSTALALAEKEDTEAEANPLAILVADAYIEAGKKSEGEAIIAQQFKNKLSEHPFMPIEGKIKSLSRLGLLYPQSEPVRQAIAQRLQAAESKIDEANSPIGVTQEIIKTYAYIGEIQKAETLLSQLPEKNRTDDLFNAVAEAYERSGQPEKANQMRREQGLQISKLVTYLTEQGRIEEAMRVISSEKSSLSRQIGYEHIAYALAKQGKKEEALRIIEEISSIDDVYKQTTSRYDIAKINILVGNSTEAVRVLNMQPIGYSGDVVDMTEVLAMLYEKQAA